MFDMNRSVARDAATDEDDTANVKFAMTSLGYYDDDDNGFSPYTDDGLFESVKSFQKDNDLKVDGVMKPEGETHCTMRENLKKNKKAGNAFGDFKRNWQNMKEANTKGADKYFHCRANYEATERGWTGSVAARGLSEAREVYGKYIKGDSEEDKKADQKANKYGRSAAKSGKYNSSKEACSVLRPNGLNEKY